MSINNKNVKFKYTTRANFPGLTKEEETFYAVKEPNKEISFYLGSKLLNKDYIDKNFVNLTGYQLIAGEKEFVNDIRISNPYSILSVPYIMDHDYVGNSINMLEPNLGRMEFYSGQGFNFKGANISIHNKIEDDRGNIIDFGGPGGEELILTGTGGASMYLGEQLHLDDFRISGVADPIANQDAATKKYVDTAPGSWTLLYEGNGSVVRNSNYIRNLNDTVNIGDKIAIEIKYGTASDSYNNRIIIFTLGNNSSSTPSATYPKTVGFSEFDGRYFKNIYFRVYLYSSTALAIGNLQLLVGDFTSGTGNQSIEWKTDTASMSVYTSKIWRIE